MVLCFVGSDLFFFIEEKTLTLLTNSVECHFWSSLCIQSEHTALTSCSSLWHPYWIFFFLSPVNFNVTSEPLSNEYCLNKGLLLHGIFYVGNYNHMMECKEMTCFRILGSTPSSHAVERAKKSSSCIFSFHVVYKELITPYPDMELYLGYN